MISKLSEGELKRRSEQLVADAKRFQVFADKEEAADQMKRWDALHLLVLASSTLATAGAVDNLAANNEAAVAQRRLDLATIGTSMRRKVDRVPVDLREFFEDRLAQVGKEQVRLQGGKKDAMS